MSQLHHQFISHLVCLCYWQIAPVYQHPFHSEGNGKHKRCSIFFVWNVDTSEGDKCFSKKEKKNLNWQKLCVLWYSFSCIFNTAVFLTLLWLQGNNILMNIYIFVFVTSKQTSPFPPPLKKHTVPRHSKGTMFSFWSSSQTQKLILQLIFIITLIKFF